MTTRLINFAQTQMTLCTSGVLFWNDERLLCVSDLHLGKSERIARRGGGLLPPYETLDTLTRLSDTIDRYNPDTVVCLGDSFDDLDAGRALDTSARDTLARLQAKRNWIWIEGNHDPGPIDIGGSYRNSYTRSGVIFRHVALNTDQPEISGHYHPKARITIKGRSLSAKAVLTCHNRMILPAFGTYTGGLNASNDAIKCLMDESATAYLLKHKIYSVPYFLTK